MYKVIVSREKIRLKLLMIYDLGTSMLFSHFSITANNIQDGPIRSVSMGKSETIKRMSSSSQIFLLRNRSS